MIHPDPTMLTYELLALVDERRRAEQRLRIALVTLSDCQAAVKDVREREARCRRRIEAASN